ncbi:MAG: hypothetical protein LBN34_07080 [Clostridiales Family XIII bacterium]|jgi:hypothetical protein|nr:hypothetical protein [Clostridiales Family XIII bacterium]
MNVFEIYLVYLSWGEGGKVRPVLVMDIKEDHIFIYGITSVSPDKKSKKIADRYVPIQDWKASGLNLPSWIDINTRIALPAGETSSLRFVGKLTIRDANRLIDKI